MPFLSFGFLKWLYVLLSPNLCFTSFLYLDWYTYKHCIDKLGIFHENQTYVLVHIKIKNGVPLKMFKLSGDVLLIVSRCCFFCGSFLLFEFHFYLRYAVLSVPCSHLITCWERADVFSLSLSLSLVVFLCFCLFSILWCFWSYMVLRCIDSDICFPL